MYIVKNNLFFLPLQGLHVITERVMGHTAFLCMCLCTTEGFLRDHLVCHCSDDVGPSDKHVRGILDHEDKVGQGRRVHRAAGARAHDDRQLGNDTGRQHVFLVVFF